MKNKSKKKSDLKARPTTCDRQIEYSKSNVANTENCSPLPLPGNPGPLARMPALFWPPRCPFLDVR